MKRILRIVALLFAITLGLFFFYCNNLKLAHQDVVSYYKKLKEKLLQRGYKASLLVISTKRIPVHNKLQVKYSGAARNSRHLSGEAIDFLVFDVNNDGKRNYVDIDIVYSILEKEIMKDSGGIGTYKNETGFLNRQMIHIDSRRTKARWYR